MNFEDDAESTVSNDSRYIENIVNWINNIDFSLNAECQYKSVFLPLE